MRTLYLDCFSGISGDMALGAFMDAGLSFKAWLGEVEKLGLGCRVLRKKVRRAGIAATKVEVRPSPAQPPRNLAAIEKVIRKSGITPRAKDVSTAIFRRLAEAEARAHGTGVGEVHFHEVGAVDSIMDIVGSAVALEMMGVERVVSSPLNLGSGVVRFSHGTFPVPAPATAELVKGLPAYCSEIKAELTTPTGAAIAATLAGSFGPMPQMDVKAVGYGAGGREVPGFPNLLRVFIGEAAERYEEDAVSVIEANIDDMDPRAYEYVMERLFEAGALDVWLTPIIMKKSRPATKLSVMADARTAPALTDIVMSETTTFGVRISGAVRRKLSRGFEEVKTRHGKVRVKVGKAGGRVLKTVPEYEDVKAVAKKSGMPFGDAVTGVLKSVEKPR